MSAGVAPDNLFVSVSASKPNLSVAWLAIVFAGPASAVLTVLILILGRGLFAHGPGVPSAGRPEAWSLLWLAMALVLVGHAVSVAGLSTLAALCWHRRQPPSPAALWSAAYHLVVASPAFAFWFSAA